MTINISRPPSVIKIGYDGENHWRPQTFDCSPLTARHPEGILTLWVMPNGVATAFPVAVTRDGDSITWTPLDSELVQGFGKLQIHCQDGNDLGKSDIMDFMVCESIVDGGEHPSETPSWAARVVEATGHYPKIQKGTWWVWDVQNAEWSDTGVSAGGDVSPEQLAEAIEDYFDKHPVEAPVQSVNGKTGAVVLDAEDVGALPADTPIPAAVTEQTVAGWGFTKNTGDYTKPSGGIPDSDIASAAVWNAKGTYSKPSGGIPKTDLASDVQEVLDSAITTGNFGSYLDNEYKAVFTLSVSGTTVTLNTSFINVYYAYASVRDAVFAIPIGGTAESPDVLFLHPTRVNATAFSITLFGENNGNRYSTTLTAASATASPMTGTLTVEPLAELPTVTAADNGKFLRVVNGAWAAQAVPSAESNSFGGGA